MTRVTRNIDPQSARDLLERVPRACIVFTSDHGPQAQPVALLWRAQRYLVGIPAEATLQPAPGQEAVLLVDEGIHFFDLRALYIRGHIQPATSPADVPAGHAWFELLPLKTVAWDYGMLREVNDEGE
jgi:hypothetical protein